MKFNATHHITIIWRTIPNQTPIRFLQIATEKKRIENALEFMTPCYLALSQNSNPVIIVKTKKRQTFDTQSHSIWFGDQLSYDNLNYLAKCFCRFVGICENCAVWLCFFNEHICGQAVVTLHFQSIFICSFWYFTHISQFKFTPHSVIFWNCMS